MLGYNSIAEVPYSAVFEYPLNEARVNLPAMVGGVGTVNPTLGAGVDGVEAAGLTGLVTVVVDVDIPATAVTGVGEVGDVRAAAVNRVFVTAVTGTLGSPDVEAVIGVTATPTSLTGTGGVGNVTIWSSINDQAVRETWTDIPTS